MAGTQQSRTKILASQLHHFPMHGPVSMAPSHTWVLFSRGDRSRLRSGGHRMPRGNDNQAGRPDHSGQEGKAGGSWEAAGQRGKSTPHSWDHRNCCCHRGRTCHTWAPTVLGHTLWNRMKGSHRALSLQLDPVLPPPHPYPLPHLQKGQLTAADANKKLSESLTTHRWNSRHPASPVHTGTD